MCIILNELNEFNLYSDSFNFETYRERDFTIDLDRWSKHERFRPSNVPNRWLMNVQWPILSVSLLFLSVVLGPFLYEGCLKTLERRQERWTVRKVRRLETFEVERSNASERIMENVHVYVSNLKDQLLITRNLSNLILSHKIWLYWKSMEKFWSINIKLY